MTEEISVSFSTEIHISAGTESSPKERFSQCSDQLEGRDVAEHPLPGKHHHAQMSNTVQCMDIVLDSYLLERVFCQKLDIDWESNYPVAFSASSNSLSHLPTTPTVALSDSRVP